MEMFVPDREPGAILELIDRLKAFGLRGRDAAFLASVAPCPSWDEQTQAAYLRDFRFIVPEPQRAAVAEMLQLEAW